MPWAAPFYDLKKQYPVSSDAPSERPGRVNYFVRFPPSLDVRNHRERVLLHAEKNGVLLKTFNITQQRYSAYPNYKKLHFRNLPADVTLHVDEVVRVSILDLLRRTGENSPYAYQRNATMDLILAHFLRSDVFSAQRLEVSLYCPLAGTKMHVPCRGERCLHVQCFDAFCYLGTNEEDLHPSWKCPVCDDKVLIPDMRVDLLMRDIVTEANALCTDVAFRADGSWVEAVRWQWNEEIAIDSDDSEAAPDGES